MNIWYELLAYFFELDIPKIEPIILDGDYIISFEHPDVKTLKEIRQLISTFAVDVKFDSHSRICWLRIDVGNLKKRNYKQFIELIEILIDERCVRVDNEYYI